MKKITKFTAATFAFLTGCTAASAQVVNPDAQPVVATIVAGDTHIQDVIDVGAIPIGGSIRLQVRGQCVASDGTIISSPIGPVTWEAAGALIDTVNTVQTSNQSAPVVLDQINTTTNGNIYEFAWYEPDTEVVEATFTVTKCPVFPVTAVFQVEVTAPTINPPSDTSYSLNDPMLGTHEGKPEVYIEFDSTDDGNAAASPNIGAEIGYFQRARGLIKSEDQNISEDGDGFHCIASDTWTLDSIQNSISNNTYFYDLADVVSVSSPNQTVDLETVDSPSSELVPVQEDGTFASTTREEFFETYIGYLPSSAQNHHIYKKYFMALKLLSWNFDWNVVADQNGDISFASDHKNITPETNLLWNLAPAFDGTTRTWGELDQDDCEYDPTG